MAQERTAAVATAEQVRAAVVGNHPAGAYRRLVLDAARLASGARPGQFVALAVGDEPTATLLRRAFSIHRATPFGDEFPSHGEGLEPGEGAEPGTIELVIAAHGVGSSWLAGRRPGDVVDVVGPLGRPFPLPEGPACCVLVGGGYGSAPLLWLAQALRANGSEVELVLGAASADRLFGVAEAGGGDAVHVTTDDGSVGTRGRVTDVLPDVLARRANGAAATQVYACGPMAMLRAVAGVAAQARVQAWCAVEESMACGIGVCMTCVIPVRDSGGGTRMARSCVEGPTFDAATIDWELTGGA